MSLLIGWKPLTHVCLLKSTLHLSFQFTAWTWSNMLTMFYSHFDWSYLKGMWHVFIDCWQIFHPNRKLPHSGPWLLRNVESSKAYFVVPSQLDYKYSLTCHAFSALCDTISPLLSHCKHDHFIITLELLRAWGLVKLSIVWVLNESLSNPSIKLPTLSSRVSTQTLR